MKKPGRPFVGAHDDRIVTFIAMFCRQHGYGPTFREVADDAGISLGSTAPIIARLVHDGRLTQLPGTPRTLNVPKRKASA